MTTLMYHYRMTSKQLTETFAANVKRILKETGLSQRKLAQAIGTHPSNVTRTLKGHHVPDGDTLVNFATALGVDVCELLCKPKPAKPAKK